MTVATQKRRFTPAEYYRLERDAPYKSDFYDGEIFSMARGTSLHSLVTANITGELRQRLKGKPCAAYESNLRLKVTATGLRTYPDASVYCGPLQYDPEDPEKTTALNPTVLVEVLSPSTEAYDRGFKAAHYRRVESLMAYVLVATDGPRVEVHRRQPDRNWSIEDVTGLDAQIPLESIGVQLPMAEVYDRVVFSERPSPPATG